MKEIDSSSSEDEATMQALKDVLDPTFFNETLFKQNVDSNISNKVKAEHFVEQKISLRKTQDQNDQFDNNFGLTQSSKQFIAKRLSDFLNNIIVEENGIIDKHLKDYHNLKDVSESGIKLLNSSANILKIEEREDESCNIQKPKRKKQKQVDDISENDKIKSVVVTPDWVLSKHNSKLWVNRKKGKEYKYKKLKNGMLVAVNE